MYMNSNFRNADEIDRLLADTFTDFALSKGEKGAIKSILSDASANDLALWRNRCFIAANKFASEGHRSEVVLTWLEGMIKLLIPQETAAPAVKACFSPREDCAAAIIALINRSIKSMDLCVFTITDDRLTAAILAAHARGVKVRIMTDNEKSYDEGSDTWRMALAGIPVFVDTSHFHMHHKFGIFDDRIVLTGSYNWTRSASANNEENLVILEDRGLIRRFQNEFEQLLVQPGTKPMK